MEIMPFWSGVVRILRRRIVLGLIFGLSVVYCGFSLFNPDRKGITLGIDYDDSDTNILLHSNNDDLIEEEGEGNDMYKVSDRALPWQMDTSNNEGNGHLLADDITYSSKSDILMTSCRNSIQGKTLIVDDRGYVCPRQEILPNGCCAIAITTEGQTPPIVKKDRYSCNTCNVQGCCAIYEYCVSCCLHPVKYIKSKKKSEGEIRKETLKTRRGEDVLKLRLRNLDRFQVCLAFCRTSSASVRHENTYKDPLSKHCYNLNHYTNLQQRPRRDLVWINNNVDSPVAVVTSFSVLMSFTFLPKSLYYLVNKSFILLNSFVIKEIVA